MTRKLLAVQIMASLSFIAGSCTPQSDFPVLTGPYLGQRPPGRMPEIFAPGLISTERVELNSVFSPDGRYLFFTSTRTGNGDIYWVDATLIEDLRPF